MQESHQKFSMLGAITFIGIITGLMGLAVAANYWEQDIMLVALIGPAVAAVGILGIVESMPVLVVATVISLIVVLSPTGRCLIRGRWTTGMIVAQVVFVIPNLLGAVFAWALFSIEM
jgi:hypothetical protein